MLARHVPRFACARAAVDVRARSATRARTQRARERRSRGARAYRTVALARRYSAAAGRVLASLAAAPYVGEPGDTDAVLTHNAHDCGSDGCTVVETDFYALEAAGRALGLWTWL